MPTWKLSQTKLSEIWFQSYAGSLWCCHLSQANALLHMYVHVVTIKMRTTAGQHMKEQTGFILFFVLALDN